MRAYLSIRRFDDPPSGTRWTLPPEWRCVGYKVRLPCSKPVLYGVVRCRGRHRMDRRLCEECAVKLADFYGVSLPEKPGERLRWPAERQEASRGE